MLTKKRKKPERNTTLVPLMIGFNGDLNQRQKTSQITNQQVFARPSSSIGHGLPRQQ
jgi:hypothetical protein